MENILSWVLARKLWLGIGLGILIVLTGLILVAGRRHDNNYQDQRQSNAIPRRQSTVSPSPKVEQSPLTSSPTPLAKVATSRSPDSPSATASQKPAAAPTPRVTSVATTETNNSGETKFSVPIFDPNVVKNITPLGELNGGYEEVQTVAGVMINLKSADNEIELKAPTDMTLQSYSYHKVSYAPGANWTLIFKVNQYVTLRVDHLTRVSDRISAATTSTAKDSSAEDFLRQGVDVKAGEVFAYTSGTKPAANWNIYLFDTRVKNSFINQRRYEGSQVGMRLINAKCVFDYYDEPSRQSFMTLMGYSQAGQSVDCGKVSRDVAGTISGMWHFSRDGVGVPEERDGRYASPLSIIKNSAGEVTIDQVDDKRLDFRLTSGTPKDPAEIRDAHCYQLTEAMQAGGGYAYFKLVSENEMQFAYGSSGQCPSEFPSAQAKSYYR